MSKEIEVQTGQHHGAQALSDKLEASAKARGWIMRGVVIFLILVFCGGLAWGANDLLSREGKFPPQAEPDETITNPPEGAQAICAYIEQAIAMALEERPRFVMETNYSLDGDYLDTIAFAGEAAHLTAMAKLVAPGVTEQLHESSPKQETQYGDDFSAWLWALPAADQLEEATCEFIFYKCTACGREEKEPLDACPKCNAKEDPDAKAPLFGVGYRGNYTFTLKLPDEADDVISEVFHARTQEEVLALLAGPLEGFADIGTISRDHRNSRIVAVVGRTTGKLQSLQFKQDYDVDMELRLARDFDAADGAIFSCTLGESTNFSFTWLGVTLSARERTMDLSDNSQLTARIDAPGGQNTPLTWTSSDESLCTVDQEGYLKTAKKGLRKAGRKYGDVTITAFFEHDGEVYADECAVYVKIPVEKAALDRRNISLQPGGTRQMKVTLSPRGATYKEVDWYTENPDIAVVDENGLVRAVGPGKTVIFAVTRDGYYRSSCNVTVAGGER